MSSVNETLQNLQRFFDERIRQHGATPKGVDWKSQEAQYIRFDQLLQIARNPQESFSLIDYGCGYGGLVDYLQARGYQFTYIGYDMTPAVIEAARETYGHLEHCTFTYDLGAVKPADYVIGSGLFNMKMDASLDEWQTHMFRTLDSMWALSKRGMSFNSLTSYSDADYMRPDLYYPDPKDVFDYCKRHYSRNVALLHDYDLYDFTILVRR